MLCSAYDDMAGFSIKNTRGVTVVLLPSSLAVLDVCFAYLGARGPVPREIDVPLEGDGRLGPAPAAEGSACRCQQASIGAERGGGGPSPSLC